MEEKQLKEILDYLKSSERNVLIEVEVPSSKKQEFEAEYAAATNNLPLPSKSDEAPYYVFPQGTNKWGLELRLYFSSDANIPIYLLNLSVDNTRHGYETYDKRINNNDFIFLLFKNGFKVGKN